MVPLYYALALMIICVVIALLFIRWQMAKNRVHLLEKEKESQLLAERFNMALAENAELKANVQTERDISEQRAIQLSALETELKHLSRENEQKAEEVKALKEQMTAEFENIANRVLTRQSQEMSMMQSRKLADVLSPFKDKIESFEKQVADTYEKELRDKLSLQGEVKRLYELNHKISEEAGNLTRALKGDVKKMGNWGEMILERILEQSGLTKGREYEREVVSRNAEGDTIRPDVVVYLPDNKHVIIDSKLSLVAYERYVNATDVDEQKKNLKDHLLSMRQHIKGLHEKNYASGIDFQSPDFVLMFVPVEASFAVAVEADKELFAFAWERKIVPVSPSTLLATLKTIVSIWKQENQSRNAMEIARQAGALYDKLVAFTQDLQRIGKSIEHLQGVYATSMNKLVNGKGNIISRAEKMRELGAKTSKTFPSGLEQSKSLFAAMEEE
ncbi:DNA recombination protein RmuC [Marinilabiliaceae bacterium JC017]|nr:DNA recombination protein RmuC [Marinilabiliaceae bacterium JC017]